MVGVVLPGDNARLGVLFSSASASKVIVINVLLLPVFESSLFGNGIVFIFGDVNSHVLLVRVYKKKTYDNIEIIAVSWVS